jgi:hypothetical protein
MWRRELPITTVDGALAFVRATGKHRYVAGRAHFIHALAACDLDIAGNNEGLQRWARGVIDDDAIDKASRDERLVRRATEAEIAAVLEFFWSERTRERARDALFDRLDAFDVDVRITPEPFEDDDDAFPVMIDAGIELLALAELDQERHRGAIEAFGESIRFDVARFEEEEHLPRVVHLQELPAIGVSELVRGAEHGELASELSMWLSGNETYQDYVIRGVLRAAKLA